MAVMQIKGTYNLPNFPLKISFGTFTFDSSYPTGGEAMDLSTEFDDVYGVHFENLGSTAGTGALVFNYDRANKKVQAYGGAAANVELTELTAAHSLTGFTKVGFIAFGFKA